jgi:hypothetical protein
VPDCKALAYDWYHKNRVISSFDFYKQDITKITFHPKDNHKVCTSGTDNFQMWSMQEGTFKPLSEFKNLPTSAKLNESIVFTDHTWTENDYLIGCSKTGDLFVIEIFDVIQVMPYDPKGKYCSVIGITSIGFCAGTEDGVLCFWRYVQEKKKFEFVCKWSC